MWGFSKIVIHLFSQRYIRVAINAFTRSVNKCLVVTSDIINKAIRENLQLKSLYYNKYLLILEFKRNSFI